jgi:hypothetical protein
MEPSTLLVNARGGRFLPARSLDLRLVDRFPRHPQLVEKSIKGGGPEAAQGRGEIGAGATLPRSALRASSLQRSYQPKYNTTNTAAVTAAPNASASGQELGLKSALSAVPSSVPHVTAGDAIASGLAAFHVIAVGAVAASALMQDIPFAVGVLRPGFIETCPGSPTKGATGRAAQLPADCSTHRTPQLPRLCPQPPAGLGALM